MGGNGDSFYGHAMSIYLQSARGKPCWYAIEAGYAYEYIDVVVRGCQHTLPRAEMARLLTQSRITRHKDLLFLPGSTHTAVGDINVSLQPGAAYVKLLIGALTSHLHGHKVASTFTMYLTPEPHMVKWDSVSNEDCQLCGKLGKLSSPHLETAEDVFTPLIQPKEPVPEPSLHDIFEKPLESLL